MCEKSEARRKTSCVMWFCENFSVLAAYHVISDISLQSYGCNMRHCAMPKMDDGYDMKIEERF
jgi:hypothetical protein